MGKTTAEQECAHVVTHGIRLLLLGIPPKLIYFKLWLSPILNNVPRNGIASIEKWWLALPQRTMIHTPCQNLCKSGKYMQQSWLTFPSRSAAGCGKGIWGVETGSRTYIYFEWVIVLDKKSWLIHHPGKPEIPSEGFS